MPEPRKVIGSSLFSLDEQLTSQQKRTLALSKNENKESSGIGGSSTGMMYQECGR